MNEDSFFVFDLNHQQVNLVILGNKYSKKMWKCLFF